MALKSLKIDSEPWKAWKIKPDLLKSFNSCDSDEAEVREFDVDELDNTNDPEVEDVDVGEPESLYGSKEAEVEHFDANSLVDSSDTKYVDTDVNNFNILEGPDKSNEGVLEKCDEENSRNLYNSEKFRDNGHTDSIRFIF